MTDLQPILQAARQAATLCRAVQGQHIVPALEAHSDEAVARKAGAEPVTIADYGAQAIVCRAISQHYPDDAVIAEEGGQQFSDLISAGDQQEIVSLIGDVLDAAVTVEQVVAWLDYGQNREAERTWIIDPIDGTKGFIQLRHYVVAVGLMNGDKRVIDGVMAAPGYDDRGALFFTHDGAAYVESLAGGGARKIEASQRTEPESLVYLESFEKSHASRELMEQVRERAGLSRARIERMDSQEKYARVAAGDADLYLRLPRIGSTRPHLVWDHAAGVALVEAAGGIVTDVDGSPLDFSLGKTLANNKGMIVSNPRIHEQVVQATLAVVQP